MNDTRASLTSWRCAAICKGLIFHFNKGECAYHATFVRFLVAQLADLKHKILIGYVQVVVLSVGQLSEELGLGK